MASLNVLLNPFSLRRTLVMGIVNVTPDSFYDGGRWENADTARAHGNALITDGADLLDIGGESSRPGADPVSTEEEQRRILPVVAALAGIGVPISVDTFHAATACAALAAGAAMINDITALRGDPGMAAVVAASGCPYVLMHMQGMPKTMQVQPQYDDVVDDVKAFFEERLYFATAEGIQEDKIWLDPGFGFGKTINQNLRLLRRLDEFKTFGRPILIGTSNKSMIGAVLEAAVDDRMEGTAATVAFAIARGVHCIRVHDVKTMARVARMCDAIVYGRH